MLHLALSMRKVCIYVKHKLHAILTSRYMSCPELFWKSLCQRVSGSCQVLCLCVLLVSEWKSKCKEQYVCVYVKRPSLTQQLESYIPELASLSIYERIDEIGFYDAPPLGVPGSGQPAWPGRSARGGPTSFGEVYLCVISNILWPYLVQGLLEPWGHQSSLELHS